MANTKSIAVAALAAFLTISQVQADVSLTAQDWLDVCKASDGTKYCVTYLSGVHDTLLTLEAMHVIHQLYCPGRIRNSELQIAAMDYIRLHPEHASQMIPIVFIKAWSEKWPCIGGLE